MKTLSFVCGLAWSLLIASDVSAQQWEWQSPLPQGNNLTDVDMLENGGGYAISELTSLLQTTDNGVTWNLIQLPGNFSIAGMSFLNMQEGWIAVTRFVYNSPESGAYVLHTDNGGLTWSEFLVGDSLIATDIHFFNENTGIVAGGDHDHQQAMFARTTDGGASWAITRIDTVSRIESLFFLNDQYGWAVNAVVLRTTNGGATWEQLTDRYEASLNKVQFFNDLQGVGLRWSNFRRTADGGATWVTTRLPNDMFALGMEFQDPNTGWVVGSNGVAMKTTDGGINWQPQSCGISSYFNDIALVNDNNAIMVGGAGYIMRSTDGGTQWAMQAGQRITNYSFYAVDFSDSLSGWAVGGSYPGRIIMRTTDGGDTWLTVTDRPDLSRVWDVAVLDPLTAWVAGWEEGLYYTSDGGQNWTSYIMPESLQPTTLHVLNPDSVIVTCGDRLVYTVNGGDNWTLIPTRLPFERQGDVFFRDLLNGWCYGGKPAMIYHTTDGGVSWTEQYMEEDFSETVVTCLHFTDSQIGWAAVWNGSILHTTDGGEIWIEIPMQQEFGDWSSMSWPDADHGYLINDYESTFYTTDGGETWLKMVSPFSTYQTDCDFSDANYGWVVGGNGTIVKWNSNFLPVPPQPHAAVPVHCSLAAYPNPFNPTTQLEFSIPITGRAILTVYDLNGRLVQTLADGLLSAGEYRQSFDGARLPSGIYFARLQGSTYSATHKLVMLK